MNILFFLTPKSEVAYIFEDETLRQTVEKMEHRKFSCIPLLSMDGRYIGTISEGDLLWGLKRLNTMDVKEMEDISIMTIPRRATYKPVHADADMEDLLDRAINQNYVPVIDDQGFFIGIITRKEIIKYCYKELKAAYADRQTDSPAQENNYKNPRHLCISHQHNAGGFHLFLISLFIIPLTENPSVSGFPDEQRTPEVCSPPGSFLHQ